MASLPTKGEASTYSDYFSNRRTASGDVYKHTEYTAALLPKSRWYVVNLGTKLRLTYGKRKIVVKVNDRGAGKGESRVLDLSRAAMAYLIGKQTSAINDRNASIIQLDLIEVVPKDTPAGPVSA